ncbi:hypothetical protein N8I77_005133 [Diaporthe amygdali]|uniref:Uncharacterized protein n=1 Tax=Phomopsis amygdali TaxID=1214568 RepID=A0AAD9SNI5_PHOAM|nr:hypothetical protein N8I77_005133 [Diaporthe amygdali]
MSLDWPADRALPLFPDIARQIEYANLSAFSSDEQLLLTSLQGLVNRQQPRLYLDWPQRREESDDLINEAWREQLEAKGVQGVDVTSGPFQSIDKYKSNVRGAIVYDVKVPDTINLASTMAGIFDAVLATEELAQRFDIPISRISEVASKTSTSYVWPNVTDRLITAIKPLSTTLYANRTWDTLLKTNSSVTDASNNGTYRIDLTRFINRSNTVYPGYHGVNAIFRDYIVATAAPCVWLDSNRPREAALLDNILHQFQPNTAYLGWVPNGDEMSGVTQLARHGVYVAATDFYFNPTIFSEFRRGDQSQQPSQTESSSRLPLRNSTEIFLSLVYLEGDNIQYNQRRMFTHWNDAARGSVPLGWTISPLLRDIGPGILSYYQATSTENDLLVAGPDGAGYTYPGVWPGGALSVELATLTLIFKL